MPETKVQRRPETEREREIAPRGFWDPFYFSPFSMMRRLSEEMDRAFSSGSGLRRWAGDESTWSPAVEVRERNGNVEISAELPGLNKEDVKVECTDEGVQIEGEKKRESTSEEGGIHRTERSYGHFYRMIPLPEGANADKATAEFKNGVLQVRVPIDESKRKSRRLQITG
jgi:HSP20 family protein